MNSAYLKILGGLDTYYLFKKNKHENLKFLLINVITSSISNINLEYVKKTKKIQYNISIPFLIT